MIQTLDSTVASRDALWIKIIGCSNVYYVYLICMLDLLYSYDIHMMLHFVIYECVLKFYTVQYSFSSVAVHTVQCTQYERMPW